MNLKSCEHCNSTIPQLTGEHSRHLHLCRSLLEETECRGRKLTQQFSCGSLFGDLEKVHPAQVTLQHDPSVWYFL